ncbi:MAG: 2-oxoacid:acceptor oxidoreductase family protein [Rhodospirillales bacterium]
MGDDVEIRLSGAGGQGLLLSAHILSHAVVLEGRQVAQSQSYEPTSRGGVSRADLIVSDAPVDYPLATALDCLLVLDQIAAGISDGLIKSGATVLVDAARVPDPPAGDFALHRLPFTDTARAIGNERIANIIALGALAGLSGLCARATLERAIRAETPIRFLDLNLQAVERGYRMVAADRPAWAAG